VTCCATSVSCATCCTASVLCVTCCAKSVSRQHCLSPTATPLPMHTKVKRVCVQKSGTWRLRHQQQGPLFIPLQRDTMASRHETPTEIDAVGIEAVVHSEEALHVQKFDSVLLWHLVLLRYPVLQAGLTYEMCIFATEVHDIRAPLCFTFCLMSDFVRNVSSLLSLRNVSIVCFLSATSLVCLLSLSSLSLLSPSSPVYAVLSMHLTTHTDLICVKERYLLWTTPPLLPDMHHTP